MHHAARTILAATLALCFALPAVAGDVKPMPREWHFYQESSRADRDNYWGKLTRLVGKPAPELRLAQWHGNKTNIRENRGKVVVLDFWATWCGPCIRSIPHNNELVNKYKDDLAFVAICAPRGGETMAQVAKQHNVAYPTALDSGSANYSSYNAQWYPFYVVIDQQGIIRATGLTPNNIENAVKMLLDEAKANPKSKKQSRKSNESNTANASVSPTLAKHLEGSPQRRRILNATHGNKPPSLNATNWLNSEPMEMSEYKGKVVLVDFWATWCGPCKRAVPHTNELQAKYAEQGLVILGVCHTRGAEKMEETANRLGINYALCADVNGQTVNAYRADGFPDYFVIGRDGKVFAADVKNNNVEAVIKLALAESTS